MNYIYDIVLNFKESKRILEPFEWESSDEVLNVKKAKVYRVTKKVLEDFYNYNIKVDKNELNKFSAVLYKQNKKKYKYIAIFTDTYVSLGVLFDNEGTVIGKSKMLFDEELDSINIALKSDTKDVNYKRLDKIIKDEFLTRNDEVKKEFLLKEFRNLYKNRDYDKLKYLYIEYFGSKCDDNKNALDDLVKSLDNINERHNMLYDLLKLSFKR